MAGASKRRAVKRAAATAAAGLTLAAGAPTTTPLFPPGTADAAVAFLFPKPHPYAHDPVGWVETVLGERPTTYQKDILGSLVDNRRTAVPSCHGPGKSWIASRAIAWWIDTHPVHQTRVVWTAPSWDQVDNVIGGELRELYAAHPELGQEIDGACQIRKDGVRVGRGRKPADHDKHGIQGTHRRWVLAIGDEACGLVENITNGLKAITTGEDCRELLIGNPDDPSMPFEKCCRPGSGYHVIRINALYTPNFTRERVAEYPDVAALMEELGVPYSEEWVPDPVRASLVSPKWVSDAIRDWGRGGTVFAAKVLGQFPAVSKDTLITPAMIRRAYEVELAGMKRGQFGADIARYGSDYSVVYRNRGGVVRFKWRAGQQSTDTTTGELRMLMDLDRGVPMVMDSVGVGGPVFDFLLADEYPVVPFDGGSQAMDPARFVDARSELYFTAREMFMRDLIDLDPADPHAETLANELQEHRFFFTRDGRIRVESKDELRKAKRLGHSPDFSDAFVYSLVDASDHAVEGSEDQAPPPPSETADLHDREW